MKIIKTGKKKYPIKAILSNGKKLTIPKQKEFASDWLKHHGCSLMAEYVALQWLGVKKFLKGKEIVGIYPINLMKWHKNHTKDQVKSKVTVKGVAEGINRIAKGKGKATYYPTVTEERIKEAFKKGHIVIMEQKEPIHTILLLHDKDGSWIVNYGKVKKVNVDKIAKTATKNETYRGMLVIKEV